jgi:predicted RND superfamily exporter protein
MLALYLSGYTLSFTAMIGFVALMGIEVKNSILLVDFTNQLRREGLPLDEAIQKAGEARFVPILLTSLTAIGGLIPLVLEGSSLYSPLALVILGGLVSSTILTRVVTPVLYKLLAPEVGSDATPAPHASAAPASEPRVRESEIRQVGSATHIEIAPRPRPAASASFMTTLHAPGGFPALLPQIAHKPSALVVVSRAVVIDGQTKQDKTDDEAPAAQ